MLSAACLVVYNNIDTVGIVFGTLFSCCSNMFYHEDLLRFVFFVVDLFCFAANVCFCLLFSQNSVAQNSQNFISVTQHITIVAFGLLLGYPYRYRSNVPLSKFILVAAFNLGQWVMHNAAHFFLVPMPIQIIFKSVRGCCCCCLHLQKFDVLTIYLYLLSSAR